jgi:hypothetical protein
MTRTRLLIVSLLTLVAAAIAVPAINAAPVCTISWDGSAGDGSWGTASNWDLDRLPGTADDVCLIRAGGGLVVLNGFVNVKTVQGDMTLRQVGGDLYVTGDPEDGVLARYEQTGGGLSGPGTLRVTDADLSGGWFNHNGLLRADGDTLIHGDLGFDLGRRMQTANATWQSGSLLGRNNVVWTVTGTLNANSEAGDMWYQQWSGSVLPSIRVLGSVRKTAGTGSSTIGWAIDNENLVSADSGRLRFTGGAVESAGHFQSPGAAELEFGHPGIFTMDGGTYSGLELSGGRLDIPAGKLFTGTDLKVSGGTLGGAATGVLESTGTLELGGGAWFDGQALLRSTGFTKITGSLNFELNGGDRLETKDGEWTAGSVRGRNNVVWTNKGTFDMRAENAGDFFYEQWSGSVRPLIHNVGTIVRSAGAGASNVGWAIENDGKVDAKAGKLNFTQGGGESNGDFSSTAPGRTVLVGGEFILGDNPGKPSGGFEVGGGRAVVPDGMTHQTADLWQSGGEIGGAGTLASSGIFTITGGWMNGTGLVKSTGFTRIGGSFNLDLDRRLQTHDGEWLSGSIRGRNRVLWTNTGTFDLRSEAGNAYFESWSGPGTAVLKNTGTIVRTTGTVNGVTNMGFAIENDGRVNASSGQLRFNNGGGESNGDFSSTAPGRTVLAAGDFTLGANAATPSGGFEVAGGTVSVVDGALHQTADLWQSGGTIQGAGTLQTSGTFTWTGGWMGQSGLTRSTGTTIIDGSVNLDLDRRLETHDGAWKAGSIRARNRVLWTNTGDFDMRSEAGDAYFEHWSGPGGPVLRNAPTGILRKTQSDPAKTFTNVGLALDNDGTIRTSAGRLRFLGGGSDSTGAFEGTGGGRTVLGSGDFTIGNATFDGLEVSGGRIAVDEAKTFTGKDLFQSGGELGGAGDIVSSGTFEWSGGWAGMGTGLTKSTGTTNITGSVAVDLDHDIETHDGTWSAGSVRLRNRTSWTNTGDFALNAEDGDVYFEHWSGPGGSFLRNTGSLRKTAGVGDSDVTIQLENDGLVRAVTGNLKFHGGGSETSDGAFESVAPGRTVLNGGDFAIGNGTFDGLQVSGGRVGVADGATFTGKDLFQTGGELGGNGDVVASGTFTWSGGWAGFGGGLTKITGVTNVTGSIGVDMDHDVEIAGGTWSAGSIRMRNRTTWLNTGPFAMNSESGDLYFESWSGGGGATFRNTGTVTRAGTAEIDGPDDLGIYMPVDNDGSMTSQSGRLRLAGGGLGVSTGVFGVDLVGGSWSLGTGANFAAGGRMENTTVQLSPGTDVDMAGGQIANSTIQGDGDIRVPSGELRWSGGTIRGNGLLHVAEGASLVLDAGSKLLADRRLLQNEGNIRWETGYVSIADGATLLNEGTLDAVAEGYYIAPGGPGPSGRPAFVNTGTIVKSAGTGTTSLHYLENRGVLDIRTGIVYAPYYRQSARGRVVATLGGKVRGTEHAGLDLSSPTGLAGRVAVRLADGYTPADGDAFKIVHGGGQQVGTFTAEDLTLAGGGTLKGAVGGDGMLTFTATMPAPAPPVTRAAAEPPAAEQAPAPVAPDAADFSVRLAPGAATAITVPEGLTVQVLTPTKRASVRFDRKARKLRVKLRRGARGKRLKLRYRVVTADGTRSRIATLTVRIARAR